MSYIPYKDHEIVNGHIIFKKIVGDECPSNPLEDCDAMGSIFSFSNRHVNSIDKERTDQLLHEHGKDAVFLSYFEHGNCLWGVKGSMGSMPDFQWDGVGTAGLWIPDKYLIEEAEKFDEKERRAKMEEWAKQACELYTQWCNGEVYGVIVKAYKAKYHEEGELYDSEEDYRYDEEVFDESVFGIYGYEHAEEEIKDNFMPWVHKELGEKITA